MRKRWKQQDAEENGFASWGGYMEAKKSKLLEQFSNAVSKEDVEKTRIFEGVSIFVNGYTVPSADELRRIMMLHGGVYHHYQTDRTTHVIASNLPHSKMKQIETHKIVKPQWIVDCLKAGRLLDFHPYLLYNTQPLLNFGNTKTAAEPGFLSEFYSNSRLHHISTMGAMFKQYVNELREASTGVFLGREMLREWKMKENKSSVVLSSDRVIMHIDMDCFFVSVGLRNRPHLRGLPVAVTHAKRNASSHGRGASRAFEINYYKKKYGEDTVEDVDETDSMAEIASCSYEARKQGVTNGMFLGNALKLCPDLKTIPYDFEGYKQVSYCLYNTVASFTLNIEAVSCDEMLVDCTDVLQQVSVSPLDFSQFLRQQIKNKTGCTASTGFGSNRLLARLATKRAKPNGQLYVDPSAVATFITDVKLHDLPGVGWSLSKRLNAMGLHTCSDLQSRSLLQLQKEFGNKTGHALYKHCRGEDDQPLHFGQKRKSVSAEVNYGIRFKGKDEMDSFLTQLSEEVATRLHAVKSRGRCITLKIMVRAKEAPVETAKYLGHGVCNHVTKSVTLGAATGDKNVIAREVLGISRQLSLNPCDLRGIGIQISRLEKSSSHCGVLDGFLKHNISAQQTENREMSGRLSVAHAGIVTTMHTESVPVTCQTHEECVPETPLSLYSSLNKKEVLALVREWVANEEDPQVCDVDMLTDYLEKQVFGRNLDTLDVVIRCFRRCVEKRSSEQWSSALNSVLDRVQRVMVLIYGATLKLPPD